MPLDSIALQNCDFLREHCEHYKQCISYYFSIPIDIGSGIELGHLGETEKSLTKCVLLTVK